MYAEPGIHAGTPSFFSGDRCSRTIDWWLDALCSVRGGVVHAFPSGVPELIVEHEFLEQVLDGEWSLSRSISFVDSHGKNGWAVLYRHWQDGNVELISPDGSVLPDWRIREVFRTRDVGQIAHRVRCTDKGARLV